MGERVVMFKYPMKMLERYTPLKFGAMHAGKSATIQLSQHEDIVYISLEGEMRFLIEVNGVAYKPPQEQDG